MHVSYPCLLRKCENGCFDSSLSRTKGYHVVQLQMTMGFLIKCQTADEGRMDACDSEVVYVLLASTRWK